MARIPASRRLLLALGACMALAVQPAMADQFAVAGLTRAEVAPFLGALQAAVAKHDSAAVAKMVLFPMRLRGKAGPRNPAELDRDFDIVFNAKVRDALRRQTVDTLRASSYGVWVGLGEIWINSVCESSEAAGGCKTYRLVVWSVNN